jgi:drug/metabolite transporter (DMT)-like permease
LPVHHPLQIMNSPSPLDVLLRADRPLQGIAWMVAGMFLLSVLDALSKHAVSQLSIPVLMAARSAMVLVLLVPWALRSGGWSTLRTRRPWAQLLRGLLVVCSMWAFFESLRWLSLATVIAICFAAPLFMTLLSVPLLHERVGAHRWGALLAGFVGVGLIVGPQALDGELGLGAWLALAAALFYAASMTSVRWLSPTESDLSMMVWQNLTVCLVGTVGLCFVPLEVGPGMWPVIGFMAVLVLLGQLCTFRALRMAPVGVVAPFHYSELLWAALFGWAFWHEWPGAHVWWGAFLVVGAGLYTLWRERVRSMAAG